MNILDVVKLIPAGKNIAIKVGSTDNIWPVEEVINHYSDGNKKIPEVVGIDTVFCPEFGDEEPMVQLTIK